MNMYVCFENIINDAIQRELSEGLIPREFSIEATADGWEVTDRNDPCNETLYINLEIA